MSTSAIPPISSIDYGSATATPPQQRVLTDVLSQLEQSIGTGDLAGAQTYLNAFEALSPSSASGNNALGTFLSSVATSLQDGSVSEAQGALATYQAASPSTPPATAAPVGDSAASIAGGLILSQIQLNLVDSLLGPDNSAAGASSDSSSSSFSSLLNILNAAYGTSTSSPATPPASPSSTATSSPYDTLVAAIHANLTSGTGLSSTDLAYLNPTGNYVNTSA